MADNVKEVVDVESDDEALLEQLEQEDAAREEAEQEQEPPKKEEKKEEKPEKPRPPVKPFVHLHVHTEFSLLDGATRLVAPNHKDNPLVDKAIEKGMPGMAITDHGNMFGVFTFYKAMKKAGLKPVIGCEFYTCENMHEQTGRNGSFNHLVLIAKNNVGYRNLVQLDSMAYVDGFYYKPRIDIETLKKHSEGVICLSACLAGRIPELLLENNYDEAKNYAIMLRDMFAPGDFYIELQDHGIEEQRRVNPLLVKIAREIGVKVVATNDVHYAEREDAEMHDVMLCIQTGKTIDDPERMRFETDQFYLKTYEEMMQTFSWCPEAVTNTVEVMEKCDVVIEKQDLQPPYVAEDGSSSPDYLRRMAYKGLEWRYGTITPEIRQRAERELEVIITKGFADYYLVVWDFINYARTHGIPVGAGRGSGVGSIIAYAIRITDVDPLKYNLLFERFLNPERESPPDFDVDFCYERRGEVIEYVTRKYGSDKVCQILALGTMKAKAAIKKIARVYNVPLADVNKLTKTIANNPKVTLANVFHKSEKEDEVKLYSPEAVEVYNTDPMMRQVIDMAYKLEAMPCNCSKHAAGVVICKEVISDYVPLQRNGEDITTQFQKEEVEEMGMLKMDFLGLKTLTDIDKARQYVKEDHGVDVDFDKLGYDDPEVYRQISSGDTDAVFQLESAGMKKFMKDLQPSSLEDVIAGVSLYRPGPMDSIPKYIASKKNPESVTYRHPLLRPILEMTYGCLVYQEQVMQMAQLLAGYSLGAADMLRRAMGKKKAEVMEAQRKIFLYGAPPEPAKYSTDGRLIGLAKPRIPGAIEVGIVDENTANEIFDEMAGFAKYAFNKSHAAAYAVLSYQTAFYKRYYEIELFAAVINNRITNAEEVQKYLTILRDNGFEILPPDINKSRVLFKVEDGKLRYGLNGVKNVGADAMQALVEEREKNGEYKSVSDMLSRLETGVINKRIMEGLIKAGAFDCFGYTRSALMASYERLLKQAARDRKGKESGQISLFDLMGEDAAPEDDIPPLAEYPQMQKLALEKEALGVYLSGHPLDAYKEELKQESFTLSPLVDYIKNAAAAEEGEDEDESGAEELLGVQSAFDGKYVSLCGMLHGVSKKTTKDAKIMAYATIEDLYSSIEAVFFPRTYDKYRALIAEDAIVRLNGRLRFENGKVTMSVADVIPWGGKSEYAAEEENPAEEACPVDTALYLRIENDRDLEAAEEYIKLNPGRHPVFVQRGRTLSRLNGLGADLDGTLEYQLKAVLGAANVKTGALPGTKATSGQ